MERAEAEAVYEQGRETVVAVLLELSAQNALLRREVADLRERVASQKGAMPRWSRARTATRATPRCRPARIRRPRLSAARLRPRGAGAVPSRATQATVVIWRRSSRSTR